MATLKAIKTRIKSTKNISQITKAMQMVAASKMKKAQNIALAGKPYAAKILQVVKSLARKTDPQLHPLLRRQEEIKTYLLILITTNKGLCGSLNTNLFRFLSKFLDQQTSRGNTFDFITLGKKGQDFIFKTGGRYLADFSATSPFTKTVAPIAQIVSKGFLNQEYGRVYLAYNDFVNALKQKPTLKRILPIVLAKEEPPKLDLLKGRLKTEDILYEPSPRQILDFLLPFYLENQIREAILEAEASKHSARMIAMKNATENALDLMDGLTLEYNKARQKNITLEIADIATARVSMEKKS